MTKLSLSPEEIVGFFVGEGCFTVESGRDPKYLLGWRIRPYVSIAIRKDNQDILYAIQEKIGCGNVYNLDFGRYKKYQNRGWKPQVKWKVSNITDLYHKVVPFFDRYHLFGTKANAFAVFRKLVMYKYEQIDRQQASLEMMKSLAQDLQQINKRGL